MAVEGATMRIVDAEIAMQIEEYHKSMKDDPAYQGRHACKMGYGFMTNPYGVGTEESKAWEAGYNQQTDFYCSIGK